MRLLTPVSACACVRVCCRVLPVGCLALPPRSGTALDRMRKDVASTVASTVSSTAAAVGSVTATVKGSVAVALANSIAAAAESVAVANAVMQRVRACRGLSGVV